MVNKVILVGVLTRDAETLQSARGPIARMRLATTSRWRDADGNPQESREFHNLVALAGRLAEICGTYCWKGRCIYVEGRLRTRDYDGSDGLRRTSTEVVIDTMHVMPSDEHGNPQQSLVPDCGHPHARAAIQCAPPVAGSEQ
jgi:single-strand DNA-binding protein